MNLKTQATNIEMTDSISAYLEKRLGALGKFVDLEDDSVRIDAELGQTSKHHQSGNIFRVELTLHNGGERHRAESKKEDIYEAIDDAKDELVRIVNRARNRKETLVKRGGRIIKQWLRGRAS